MVKKKVRKYYQTDVEKVKEEAEKLGSGIFFKPREGKNIVRILPPLTPTGLYYVRNTLHNGFRIEGFNRAFTCLDQFSQPCPVCAIIRQLKETGDKEDRKTARRLEPRTKNYANVLDRHTNTVKIWGFSTKILKVITGYITDPEWGDITDPEKGHDILIVREGEGLGTRYEVRARLKSRPVGVEDWLDMAHDLKKECVKVTPFEELKEIVEDQFGEIDSEYMEEPEDEEEEGEEEEEEKPRKKKKIKHKVEDEEEAPRKKKVIKKKKRVRVEDDEEDEEEDDDIPF